MMRLTYECDRSLVRHGAVAGAGGAAGPHRGVVLLRALRCATSRVAHSLHTSCSDCNRFNIVTFSFNKHIFITV